MYIMSADVGTTTLKACLFKVDPLFELIAEAEAGYSLYSMPGGGMEQDHDEWWPALCLATKTLIDKSGVPAENIAGFSICAQMLGLVLVDRDGIPVRRPMNYLDKRAEKQWKKGICGAPRLFGTICGEQAAP